VRGARDVRFADLYVGYRKLALAPDELITAVTLPFPPARAFAFFRKVGTRRAQSISKVVMAAVLARGKNGKFDHVRIAFGSVAPVTVRAPHAEAALHGTLGRAAAIESALAALASDIRPIDDIRSDREYRLEVAGNVLAQCVRAESARGAR
jgi:CO/xanthine dehydrogenase FAD-binding subunit